MSVKFITETVLKAQDNTKGVFAAMQRNAQAAANSMRGVQKRAEAMGKVGAGLSAGMSAPLAAAGANALNMATNFDDAMNTTQSKLLVGAKAMEPLRNMAKDLGSTTAFSASEAGQAMSFLAQAGYDADKILRTTPKTLDLAAAAGLDLATAADIASNVIGSFKLDQTKDVAQFEKNFQRVTDVLALTSAKANTSVEELADAFKDAAPVAAGFGMNIEQTAATVGMLSNMGIKAGEAGTAMKTMLSTLANPVGGAEKALKKLSLSSKDFFEKSDKGKDTFQGVSNMLMKLKKSGASASDTLAIFGQEAGPRLMAIMDSAASIEELEEKLKNGGAAAMMAKIRMQGLPGVMASLRSAWEGANLALAESGGFKVVIDGLKGATQALQRFAKANPEMLASMVKWGIAAAVAGPALMAVAGTIASVGVIAKTAAGGMAFLSASALPLAAGMAAVAAAGYLIYDNWDLVARFGRGLWKGMSDTIADFSETFSAMVNTVSGWIWPKTDMGEDIEFAADKVWRMQQAVQDWGKTIGQWVPHAIGAFAAFKTFKAGVSFIAALKKIALKAQINSLLLSGLAKDALSPLAKRMKAATSATLDFARNALKTATSSAKNGALALAGMAKTGYLAVAAAAKTATIATMAFASHGLAALATGAKTGTLAAFGLISKGLRAVALAARAASLALLANPIGLALTAIAGAAYLVYKNWDKLVNLWNNSELKKQVMPLISGTLDYAREKWEQFKGWWDNATLLEKTLGILTGSMQVAKTVAGDLFQWWTGESFEQKAMEVQTSLISAAMNLGQKFSDWWHGLSFPEIILSIPNPFTPILMAGKELLDWLSVSNLGDKLKSMGSGVLGSIKSFIGGDGEDGQRAIGGTVTSGGIYRVNERGPELLNMAGQTYLMASQNGTVTPLRDLYAGFEPRNQSSVVNNNRSSTANNWQHHQNLYRMVAESPAFMQAANSPVYQAHRHHQSLMDSQRMVNAPGATSLATVNRPHYMGMGGQPLSIPAFDLPVVGSPEVSGRVDAEITVRIEADEGLRVGNAGVETNHAGELVRNVGVTMVAV